MGLIRVNSRSSRDLTGYKRQERKVIRLSGHQAMAIRSSGDVVIDDLRMNIDYFSVASVCSFDTAQDGVCG